MMLKEMRRSSMMGGIQSSDVSYDPSVVFLLVNPRVPAQGYVPLRGTGTGWALDTRGFTPVLP